MHVAKHLLIVTSTMKTSVIILVSLFTTGITANSYCDQQYEQLDIITNNIKQKCSTDNTTIKTCCDLPSIRPPGIYQMQYLCGGRWSTASVFCDTKTGDGGWTVIQRRINGYENFSRSWGDYDEGFGDLNGEFWYGLRNLNCLTQTGQWELRVDFQFQNGTISYLHYIMFRVGCATDEYPLTIGGFIGITPTDPFLTMMHNGMKFSTYDKDNDRVDGGNCAVQNRGAIDNGGWWYNNCWNIDLNMKYKPTDWGFMLLANTWYNPKWVEMKIRPLKCSL